jgi:hypothetical protein
MDGRNLIIFSLNMIAELTTLSSKIRILVLLFDTKALQHKQTRNFFYNTIQMHKLAHQIQPKPSKPLRIGHGMLISMMISAIIKNQKIVLCFAKSTIDFFDLARPI